MVKAMIIVADRFEAVGNAEPANEWNVEEAGAAQVLRAMKMSEPDLTNAEVASKLRIRYLPVLEDLQIELKRRGD